MKPKWTLRKVLPTLILLAALAVLLANSVLSYRFAKVEARQRASERVIAMGSHLDMMSQYLVARGEGDILRDAVATLASLPDLKWAGILDPDLRIVASTLPELNGRGVREAMQMFPVLSRALSLDHTSGLDAENAGYRVVDSAESGQVAGYFGVLPGSTVGGSPSTTAISTIIVMESDALRHIVMDRVWPLMAAGGLVILLIASLFWTLMNRIVQRPLSRLVDKSRKLTSGKFHVSATLAGISELSEINTALNHLAVQAGSGEHAKRLNERLMDIVEHSINEIYVVDANDFRIVSANRIARINRGYSLQQSDVAFPWDFLPGADVRPLEMRLHLLRSGASAIEVFDTRLLRNDGTPYDVALTLQLLVSAPPPVVLVIARDVSELRQKYSELQLHDRAMDSVDIGLSIVDGTKENFPLVYVNSAWCRMNGTDTSQALGKPLLQRIQVERNEEALVQLEQACSSGEAVEVLLECRREDGSTYLEEMALSPVNSSTGMVTHFICISRDITEKLATMKRLEHAMKLESVGILSSGLAHDFNNILSVVQGNLEFLRLSLDKEDQLELVREAEGAVQVGTRLSRRLLAFARRSDLELEPDIVDVNKQVLDSIDLIRGALDESVTLSTVLGVGVWSIYCDSSQLENALINLVINARDAMPTGGIVAMSTSNVSLGNGGSELRPQCSPGDYVCISVTDTGHGMSEEVKARSLEPFFTTKETGRGTGLGLSTTHAFVTQSGGQLSVESTPGTGTTISLYFPRNEMRSSPSSLPDTPAMSNERVDVTTGRRVLVVDDNEAVARVTVRRLRSLEYQASKVATVDDAKQVLARKAADGSPYDTVITDILMEHDNAGYELANWISRHQPGCEILFTSAYSDARPENMRKIALLQKPYSLAELESVLKNLRHEAR
ncbi:MAG: PAS domain S-box protein [Granulosicoccus sp.]|nr:PAS domain S-box protein [Granulosicoccus sp.]